MSTAFTGHEQLSLLVNSEVELKMERIEKLDFTMVKLKLQDVEEGQGWSQEMCDLVEGEYKRFLALKGAYPDQEVVPNRLVDLFWHQHILDTERYAQDCEAIFGYFLHHYPYFGMRGEEDYTNLCNAFEATKDLYEFHFGTSWDTSEVDSRSAKCRTQCKPVKCK